MAAFVKGLDPNHLLTVGEEGFYPAGLQQVRPAGSRGLLMVIDANLHKRQPPIQPVLS
jgi:endo-1,4-beta-mannosidase